MQGASTRQHIAARELALLDAAEVGRHTVAGSHRLDLLVVALQAADPYEPSTRNDLHLLTHAQRTVDQGAGDDGAEPAHREDAIDRQSRPARILAKGRFPEQRVEPGAKPRSIVIPRRFSSASRSGSMPVSAVMSVDLPWSMWPAVPTTKLISPGLLSPPRPRRSGSRPLLVTLFVGRGSTRPSPLVR